MGNIFSDIFKGAVIRASRESLVKKPVEVPEKLLKEHPEEHNKLEDLIILGVLLSLVAGADDKWLPEEEKKIVDILIEKGNVSEDEAGYVIAAAREAIEKRPEIQGFTREINQKEYSHRVRIVELLFRVAMADRELAESEVEEIRKISGLLWVSHKDFIDAKMKVKKEEGG